MSQRSSFWIAEGLLLLTGISEGLYPVIMRIAGREYPPLSFLTFSIVVSTLLLLLRMAFTRSFPRRIPLHVLLTAAGVSFTILSGFVLILFASRTTTAINITLLLRAELVSAFLISTVFFHERSSALQLLGTVFILVGTIFVLVQGEIQFHRADMMVLFAALMFPIGNILARMALVYVPSDVLLFLRYVIGLTVLVPAMFLLENPVTFATALSGRDMGIILLYGIGILTLSKLFWYAGIKVIPLAKATFLGSTAPIFSVIFAFFILHEVPTAFQWIGLALTLAGIYMLIARPRVSVSPPDLV